jgi:glycosyltransferase involved in cell wall biosynthesis
MDLPKYSFVVPVLNGETTISRCLTSIFNQTFTSFEVIVVDNGSTDKTSQIIQSFPGVQYLFEEKKVVRLLATGESRWQEASS